MTAATQGYTSTSPFGTANLSARSMAKNNDFIKMFGNTTTNNTTIEPQQTERYGASRGASLTAINTDEPSFFDFEPSSRAESPYQNQFSTPEASGMPWSNPANFRPFTPPDSASFSPKSWPYNDYQQGKPSNIFTNFHPANTRAHYGQVTPPDDENDIESLLGCQLREQFEQEENQLQRDMGKGKRKRKSTSNDSTGQSPPKRIRKYASRTSNNTDEPPKVEDVKRSKFLERNRVAASKCRQKKKEWTQNLENRARELQKDNNQLRMVVESCRQEIIFLKGELLKHSQCECEPIQTFLKSGANNFVDHKQEEDLFIREMSANGSISPGCLGSIDDNSGRSSAGNTSLSTELSSTSIADDDNALEALLTSSIKHDTNDQGIASQVAVNVGG